MSWNKCSRIPRTTWVELLVLEARLGQTLWSPWWIDLIITVTGLEKLSRALKGYGLSYNFLDP